MAKFNGSQPAEKFCSNHGAWMPAKGGDYVPMKDKLHQRWLCAECIASKTKQNHVESSGV